MIDDKEVKENLIVEEKVENSLKRNELIISIRGYEVNPGYQERMLLENNISGLCALRVIYEDDMKRYCYEVSNHENLKELVMHNKLSYDLLKNLLIQIESCLENLDRYMIEESKVLFEPEYIFLNIYSKRVSLIFFPYKETEIMDFISFAEYLITVVDQEDELAVWTAYTLERDTKKENFSLVSFLEEIREHEIEERNTREQTREEKTRESDEKELKDDLLGKKEMKLSKNRQEPTGMIIRVATGIALGLLYFLGAYLISRVYLYRYKNSIWIIVVLFAVTMIALLGNAMVMVREKNKGIEVEDRL